ncbi:hypothetical protein TNCV_902001 [Trichonephila clavipes]|nr:hypothetical protein TNCV_902001 [Trichonephila clavipes]
MVDLRHLPPLPSRKFLLCATAQCRRCGERDRCTPVLSPNSEHYTGDNRFLLGSTLISRENVLEVVGASHHSSPSINLMRGLGAQRLFRVPPCRKSTIHLQTSMPSLGLKPRPYGTPVSVVNH